MSQTPQLTELITYARPAWSETEERFVEQFIAPLAPNRDAFGNHWVRIGDQPTLWSCHTDTMESKHGKKQLQYVDGIMTLRHPKAGICLGADDTVGVWIMLNMIAAQRPGLYIFHRAEERGGLGSDFIARKTPQLLDGIDHAIAFDRKGTQSIITHQMGDRCCSGAFASALADELARCGLDYVPDSTGVFTDTANYTELVSECTNLSVGYDREHGPTEWLDVAHALALQQAMLSFDASQLSALRDPNSAYTMSREDDELFRLVYNDPDRAVKLLRMAGVTADDFLEERSYLWNER